MGLCKDSGETDMTWTELASIMNKNLREEDEYWTESAYRKKFQQAKEFYENVFSKFNNEDNYLKEIQAQKDELYKIKRQVSDQRREYNKLLISDARAENLNDTLIQVAKELNIAKPLFENKAITSYGNREAVLCLSDFHYGMVTDNIWNTYNTEICKERLKKVVEKSKYYCEINKINRLSIVFLGDGVSGAIHNSCRVASEEDTCSQLMHVAEILGECISQLADSVKETYVYSTYGNHARTIQNKNDSVHSDNIERIIPWWLEQRLQNRSDVHIVNSDFYEFIKLKVCGYTIVATHGDLDKNFKNIGMNFNALFSKLYGETVDYTITGDKHHLEEFEQYGIESILCRSLCGTDNYANDGRMYSKAGQTLLIFNEEDGRECTYNIVVK